MNTEQMVVEKPYVVTRASNSGAFQIGDRVKLVGDGSIQCVQAQGWILPHEVQEAIAGWEIELAPDAGSTPIAVVRSSSVDVTQNTVVARFATRQEAQQYIRQNTVDGVNVSTELDCDYLRIAGDEL